MGCQKNDSADILSKTPTDRDSTSKWVLTFDDPVASRAGIEHLGGKGVGLVRMSRMGLPVPPGFVITTQASTFFLLNKTFPTGMWEQITAAVAWLESATGKQFGNPTNPLLVSVRSGAPISLPGTLITIKNVGLTEQILGQICSQYGESFAVDIYLTLLREYGEAIFEIPRGKLEDIETELAKQHLPIVIEESRQLLSEFNMILPEDPWEQLAVAISAVFKSWQRNVAEDARKKMGIPWNMGTACVIEAMVFGDRDENSGTGVLHTRSPKTGEAVLTGDFILAAQGDAVVSGYRHVGTEEWETLTRFPGVLADLANYSRLLEKEFGWVQDIEFTVESQRLWILQSRKAHLSPQATVKAAVDLLTEGVFESHRQALKYAIPVLPSLQTTQFDTSVLGESAPLGKGVGAVAGAISGKMVIARLQSHLPVDVIATQAETKARDLKNAGQQVVLVSDELNPALSPVLKFVDGIVARRGGVNCHLAILARKSQIATVTGCEGLEIAENRVDFGGRHICADEAISMDGNTGYVFAGELPVIVKKEASLEESTLYEWMKSLDFRFPWACAAYPELPDADVDALRSLVPNHLSDLPWQSEKARVVELLMRVFPKGSRIGMTVIAAGNKGQLLEELCRAVDEGFEPGIRSCFIGPPPTGSAPWEMGLTKALARKFVEGDKDYLQERRCKIDGRWETYPQWIETNPNLTELIVMDNPPGLGLKADESRSRHFVFNVKCDEVKNQVIIELLLNTDQLRDIEHLQQNQAIYITMNLDIHQKFYKGTRRYRFGNAHLLAVPPESGLDFWEHEAEAYRAAISPKAWKIAQQVTKTVFDKWWEPPFALPYRMMFLNRHDLDVLEVQGRCDPEGTVEYMRIYDCKGRDEAQRARNGRQ